MKVDERATVAARKRQRQGIANLREWFGWPGYQSRAQHGRNLVYRSRDGVPVLRTAEQKARRKKRKTARASRKRNRRG